MPREIEKVRGTARIYDDDSLGFTPQKEGNPVQNDVKKVRRSTSSSNGRGKLHARSMNCGRGARAPAENGEAPTRLNASLFRALILTVARRCFSFR